MKKLSMNLLLSTAGLIGLVSSAIASPLLITERYGVDVKNTDAAVPLKKLAVEFGTPTAESGSITNAILNPQLSTGIIVNKNEENKNYLTNFVTMEADNPIIPSEMNGNVTIPLTMHAVTEEGDNDSYTGNLVITVTHGVVTSISPTDIVGSGSEFVCQLTNNVPSSDTAAPAYVTIDCSGP